MRGMPSVFVRVRRMEQQRREIELEAQIQFLAEEYGLDPGEVWAEAEALGKHREQYGPEPIATTIRRLAEQYDLAVDELRAEYDRIVTRLEHR